MSTFEEQFGHLKETDPIAYYDLKDHCSGSDSGSLDGAVALILFVIGSIIVAVFC